MKSQPFVYENRLVLWGFVGGSLDILALSREASVTKGITPRIKMGDNHFDILQFNRHIFTTPDTKRRLGN